MRNFLTNSEKNKLYTLSVQVIKFGLVGVLNTVLWLSIYYIIIFFNENLYIIGNTVGFMVSVLNAYYWNSKYVFNKKEKGNINLLVKTYISYGITFALGTVLLFIMVNYLGVSKVAAPILNLLVTIPLNYLLNKLWIYK